MNDSENYSLKKALEIINTHKLKSNTLKNFFLRNLNENEYASKILNYLGELEYDLEILNNLMTNFQLNYSKLIQSINNTTMNECNYNYEINRLYDPLKNGNNNLNNQKNNNNNFLKIIEDNNKILYDNINTNNNEENNFNNLNKTYNQLTNYRNYLRYYSCNTANNESTRNLEPQKKIIDYNTYGRLTYSINKDENNNSQNNDNKNNNIYNSYINNNDNSNVYNNNFGDNIKNFNNNINNNFDINNPENIYKNKKNYSSYDIPQKDLIMNYKRMPKYYNQNKNLNDLLSEIPKEKDKKIGRINNILSVISNNQNKLDELKLLFGNNIESQLLNRDIDDEQLDKIENVLCNTQSNKSVIPLSKRFQIHNRARSNSDKKPKRFIRNNNNDNTSNRFIRQKLSEKKFHVKNNKKVWNTERNLINNRENNYNSKEKRNKKN